MESSNNEASEYMIFTLSTHSRILHESNVFTSSLLVIIFWKYSLNLFKLLEFAGLFLLQLYILSDSLLWLLLEPHLQFKLLLPRHLFSVNIGSLVQKMSTFVSASNDRTPRIESIQESIEDLFSCFNRCDIKSVRFLFSSIVLLLSSSSFFFSLRIRDWQL